jgi:hypothetical protein
MSPGQPAGTRKVTHGFHYFPEKEGIGAGRESQAIDYHQTLTFVNVGLALGMDWPDSRG